MRTMFIVSAVALVVSGSSCDGQTTGWQSDFGSARAAADNAGLPVLIHFHAWYCGPCQRMDRDVFSDSQVLESLSDGISAVKIDVSREPELQAQYGATTVPRDVVIYPDGTSQTLHVGYVPKPAYLTMLREITARGKRIAAARNAAISVAAAAASAPASEENAATAPISPATTSDDLILGLEGFCPVRLHEMREWIVGQEKLVAEHRGIQYQFSGEAERDRFLANPAEYAPQDLGCDPVVLTEVQKAVTGSIRFGAFFDERLYLFQSPDNREQFKKNPLKFARIRSALNADQIEGTRFQ
jgi:YHS domain-containing protein/thiol-disulfide isomerase/thioredoxin